MKAVAESGVWQRDKEGRPLTLHEWADLRNDWGYTLVAGTKINGVLVRTIWEGLDDGVEVAPMYSTGVLVNGRWRQAARLFHPASETDAIAMHEQVVTMMEENQAPRAGTHAAQPGPETTEQKLAPDSEK